MTKNILVKIIPQLKDNYSYLVYSNVSKLGVVIDPADAVPIIKFIKDNDIILSGILITHHHTDHNSGINDLIKFQSTKIYSPNKNISKTSNIVKEGDLIKSDFIEFEVIATSGHTLDHVVFCNKQNNLLFSGDTLFRFGCGRIFEGTYDEMKRSLNKIKKLDDLINVYCGHEYTIHNLNFLKGIFQNDKMLDEVEQYVLKQIKNTKTSMPFNLGEEKKLNPFLSLESPTYKNFMEKRGFGSVEMFKYLRDLRNNY
jgi:hydroxyacylglutathione hydrolase|tara:strand:- start:2341 stop:3105 length:765 start_codon:yes stop_codon:yes gene_type:complete